MTFRIVRRSIVVGALCALLAGAFGGALRSQQAPDVPPRTPATLRDFFDRSVPAKLKEHHIAGATLVVVQNGRIVYSQGYGLADVERKVPVDPNRTLFRAGSVSKLFVWTALMQLYEQGKIDLDADVNTYVNVVPPTFSEPVRVRDLMSHTPGFEDRNIDLFTADPARVKNLQEVIEIDPPARILPPGRQIAYSNYGASLGGRIVEQLSGLSFEDYAQRHIFQPLGMRNTTFRQPVPESLSTDLSGGYVYTGSATRQDDDDIAAAPFERQVFEIVQGSAAGGISTTAHDMGLFLLAHLGQGRLSAPPPGASGRILQPATARLMHSTHFRPDPRGNGFAHGFMELDSHGQRVIGHGGDTIWFHSLALMLPERDLGFFLSTNSSNGMLAVAQVAEEFLNTFFPAPTGAQLMAQKPANSNGGQALRPFADYSGHYATNRRSEREMTKIMSLFMTLDVEPNASGDGLLIRDLFTGEHIDCVRTAERIFQARDGHKRFVFLENDAGEIFALLDDHLAVMTFVRIPWYEWPPLHYAILVLAAILIVSGLCARPSGAFALFSKRFRAATDPGARRAGYLGFAAVLVYAVYLLIVLVMSGGVEVIFSIPPRWPFYIPFAALLFNLAALAYLLPAWSRQYWSRLTRIYFSVLVVGLLPFFWFLYYWNLVA